MNMHSDERGLIVSWLVRLVLVFAVMGVLLYDAGSILVNYFTLGSTADDIAIEVSTDTIAGESHFNQKVFEDQARRLAKDSGARLLQFDITDEGTVKLKLRRKASTLVVGRISAISGWARATAEASVSPTQ